MGHNVNYKHIDAARRRTFNINELTMRTRFIILSLLLPGFGYLKIGQTRYFYASAVLLYTIIVCGSLFRLFPAFAGFVVIVFLVFAIYDSPDLLESKR